MFRGNPSGAVLSVSGLDSQDDLPILLVDIFVGLG